MDKKLFELNRKKIFDQMEDNSILISKAGPVKDDKYDVNRNYFYVSGVMEYENIVMLTKLNGKEIATIFINPYDEFKAKWVGAPKSDFEVKALSGIHDIRYLNNFESNLYRMLENVNTLYVDLEPNTLSSCLTSDEVFVKQVKDKCPYITVKNGRMLFAHARMEKNELEIEEMKKAISITNKGLQNVLSNMHEMYEYQLESYFDQAIKFNGATGYAFKTIAASGKNATCLHYSQNDSIAKEKDLILFDLGASVNMYCADISRTFPVSGKFTERQKTLYNIVLKGQELVLNSAKPGLSTRDLNVILIKYYAEELKKIGLIKEDKEVEKYYFHGVSHHLGLDCHDLADYTKPLTEGCVISNEPGLYIAEEGIGIRIEDDIMITKDGAICLSQEILKSVEDIEKFIKENRK